MRLDSKGVCAWGEGPGLLESLPRPSDVPNLPSEPCAHSFSALDRAQASLMRAMASLKLKQDPSARAAVEAKFDMSPEGEEIDPEEEARAAQEEADILARLDAEHDAEVAEMRASGRGRSSGGSGGSPGSRGKQVSKRQKRRLKGQAAAGGGSAGVEAGEAE